MADQREPNTVPTPLYHYTTQAGLLGIVRDNAIWATNIHYLNDESEFGHAIELARVHLTDRHTRATPSERHLIDRLLAGLLTIRGISVFVCSFSERGDLLSQWRAYSGGSQGYSIGFDFNSPAFKAALQEQGFTLDRCEYDTNEQGRRVTALISAFLDRPDAAAAILTGGRVDNYGEMFFQQFVQLAPLLKHPAFAEEKEWRIVLRPTHDTWAQTRFRAGRQVIIPYINCGLPPPDRGQPFTNVIVGPGANMNLAMDATTALLSHKTTVTRSFIAYREW